MKQPAASQRRSWTRARRAEETSSPTTIRAAPTRFDIERRTCSTSARSVGTTPTFSVPVSSRSTTCVTRRGRREAESSCVKRQEKGEAPPRVVVQPAEQTEVEQDEPAVGREQDVPAVRVGVVDAVYGHLVDVGAEELARELSGLLGREAVVGADLHAVDPLQHHSLLGHVRPDHLRHDEALVVGDEARDQLGVVRLLEKVELGAKVHLELVRERLELEELRRLGAPLEQARRRADDVEVEVDLFHHSRPPHLHDDRLAGAEERRVDLRDGGGRDRVRVDAREDVAEGLAYDRLELAEWHRRHLVDEAPELVDVDVRQEIGPRGEKLPELDVRRAEALEREPEVARPLARRRPLADDADLAQHAEQAAPPGDPRHLEGTLRPLSPRSHDAG